MLNSRLVFDFRREPPLPGLWSGYTLVELVVIISLIGILAAYAAPRFFSSSSFQGKRFFDQVENAVRYARAVAVASGCPVQVTLTSNSFTLKQQTASGNTCNTGAGFTVSVLNPSSQQPFTDTAPNNVTISPTPALTFGTTGAVTGIGPTQQFTIGGRTFTLIAATGYVNEP
jgi:MSHA pilin protein MshC